MKAFTQLLLRLEERETSEQKRKDVERFLRDTDDTALAEILRYLLYAPRKRVVSTAQLKQLALEYAGVPPWLYDECYAQTGDIPETLALIAARKETTEDISLQTVGTWYQALTTANAEARQALLVEAWRVLTCEECIVWHKLISGTLHPALTRADVAYALARLWGGVPLDVEQQIAESGLPNAESIRTMRERTRSAKSELIDFHLADTLQKDLTELGPVADWLVERKWPGVRAHLYRQGDSVIVRTRHDALLSDRFPEIASAARSIPEDLVLDGVLVAWKDSAVLPIAALEQRLARKSTPAFRKVTEVRFVAFDAVHRNGGGHASHDLLTRQDKLARFVASLPPDAPILFIPPQGILEWAKLNELVSSERDGVILKRKTSRYRSGRNDDWLKVKPAGHSIDVVLMYAERAMNSADLVLYSFGVWKQEQLVPVAKLPLTALSQEEKEELDAWVMSNTIDRFGPVRTVPPLHVFQLDLERVEIAPRRKSGVALRSAVVVRWRRNANVEHASALKDLEQLAAG